MFFQRRINPGTNQGIGRGILEWVFWRSATTAQGFAKWYLQFLSLGERSERRLIQHHQNSGALSSAAPKELADTTAALLIPIDEEARKSMPPRISSRLKTGLGC